MHRWLECLSDIWKNKKMNRRLPTLMEACIVFMNEIRRVLTPYHNKEFGKVEKRYSELKERNEKRYGKR